MAKTKTQYSCTECGALSPKWAGQCGDCGAWNTLVESVVEGNKESKSARFKGYAGATELSGVKPLQAVPQEQIIRTSTEIGELDRVLGGGLVPGSVVLLGGDPGIGKSTLLLQMACVFSRHGGVLYVTGEESLQQVSLRAARLSLNQDPVQLLAETQVERMIEQAQQVKPQLLIVDSIQTMYTDMLQSAPGSVSQVRETAAQLVRFAKQTQTMVFLVGHVTKEGALAGPRVLEHMVDTVLYFEGQSDSRFRVIRAVKNRFGAVNELGVFAMGDTGLKPINNPSAIFLSAETQQAPGTIVMATWEGSRPMLVEVQALVDTSHVANPRRVCLGLDHNRLAMLLAVLHRHAGVATYDQDVFINIVGGMRITETASDLAVLLAAISSLKNKIIPRDTLAFGEVGLSGEIRPVQSGQERIREAIKQGFKRLIVPKQNMPKPVPAGIEVIGVARLEQALLAI